MASCAIRAGLGLPIRPYTRALALVGQGTFGCLAAWCVFSVLQHSQTLGIVLALSILGLSLGIAYAAWAPVVAVATVVGWVAGSILAETSSFLFLVVGVPLAAVLELGETWRAADVPWLRWRL